MTLVDIRLLVPQRMRLSGTVTVIWPFEVLLGRLFQEQRSVVGRSVGRSSILHWSHILLFTTREK